MWSKRPASERLVVLEFEPLGHMVKVRSELMLQTMVAVSSGLLYAAAQVVWPAAHVTGMQVGLAGSFCIDGSTVIPPSEKG